MNSKQINKAFDLALRRAQAKGLTDPEAITEAMADDPAMRQVLDDPGVRDIIEKRMLRYIVELVEELAAENGWELAR